MTPTRSPRCGRRRWFERGLAGEGWHWACCWRLFAVFRFLARELPVGGAERPRRAGLACPAPCHSGPDNHRPSLLYLRGTRQPDTALPHPRGMPVFQANARGNVSGGQGRWVTGSRKYRRRCRPVGRHRRTWREPVARRPWLPWRRTLHAARRTSNAGRRTSNDCIPTRGKTAQSRKLNLPVPRKPPLNPETAAKASKSLRPQPARAQRMTGTPAPATGQNAGSRDHRTPGRRSVRLSADLPG